MFNEKRGTSLPPSDSILRNENYGVRPKAFARLSAVLVNFSVKPGAIADTFTNNSLSLCREWKEKFDLVDDDETDTLKYHYRNRFIFRPDLSAPGLTGNEVVTMLNPRKERDATTNTHFEKIISRFVMCSYHGHFVGGQCR